MSAKILAALLAAGSLLPVPAFAAVQTPAAARANDAGTMLRALFAASDEASLARHPMEAIGRGDRRWADQYGEPFSDATIEADRAAIVADLAALDRIDRSRLGPVERLAYDQFKLDRSIALEAYDPAVLRVSTMLPLDHFGSIQVYYPDTASGAGSAPFETVADYDSNLRRNAGYAAALDQAIARFREGMAQGVVQPKLVVRNMIAGIDALTALPVEQSPFYGPIGRFPDAVPAAERTRLAAAYRANITQVLMPAYARLRTFLADEYLPAAREGVGLSSLKGGDRLYRYLIHANTTLPLDPDAVHKLGLSEVARLRAAMEQQQKVAGVPGTLDQFFTFLRTDPRFTPKSADALRQSYEAVGRKVDARVAEQFALIPKTPLAIRPVPPYREKTDAAGSYQQGTPDGTRPGVFYYNTYDLPSRYTWGIETLYLHEAIPGHHFQISLAQENAQLPNFMRFGGNTAYVEGWALYAETLWPDFGLETDPYQRLGGLSDEMLRAMRLVVDTGLHAKDWSRDQAVKYMLDNSPMAPVDAAAEVERYIAIPGQALSYKIGQLTILKLKAEAKAALGTRFDPRGFHAAVLDTGALAMPVLEEKIRAWIGTEKAKAAR